MRGDRLTEFPSGAVTFLFSDIEGSTRLVKALRERYARVLAEHRQLVRAAIAGHGGHEVDTQGDAFFAVFGEAKQAVLCALEVQRSLAAHDWPAGTRVRVRMGIHTGHCVPAEGMYTGLAVHRAARICAAARGGQVLISQATQTLVEDEEEGEERGFTLADLGEHHLKDLDRPVRLFQLAAPGLEPPDERVTRPGGQDGPAGGPAAGVHGWSTALTSFIGRAAQVAEVAGLLGEFRLVTVTGPGGSGKTRLAGEVATSAAARFADGVWLVELGPVQDPAQVASVVAAALGVREQPGLSAADAVARVLARQQLLLALFADRARQADTRFTLDERTGPGVARLVRRLDGIPLAIELAAARIEALGVTQLLDRLDDRFDLLTTGPVGARSASVAGRHRGLELPAAR